MKYPVFFVGRGEAKTRIACFWPLGDGPPPQLYPLSNPKFSSFWWVEWTSRYIRLMAFNQGLAWWLWVYSRDFVVSNGYKHTPITADSVPEMIRLIFSSYLSLFLFISLLFLRLSRKMLITDGKCLHGGPSTWPLVAPPHTASRKPKKGYWHMPQLKLSYRLSWTSWSIR